MRLKTAGWKAFREWAANADYEAAKRLGMEDYRCADIKQATDADIRICEEDWSMRGVVYYLLLEEWKKTLTGHNLDDLFTMEEGD